METDIYCLYRFVNMSLDKRENQAHTAKGFLTIPEEATYKFGVGKVLCKTVYGAKIIIGRPSENVLTTGLLQARWKQTAFALEGPPSVGTENYRNPLGNKSKKKNGVRRRTSRPSDFNFYWRQRFQPVRRELKMNGVFTHVFRPCRSDGPCVRFVRRNQTIIPLDDNLRIRRFRRFTIVQKQSDDSNFLFVDCCCCCCSFGYHVVRAEHLSVDDFTDNNGYEVGNVYTDNF